VLWNYVFSGKEVQGKKRPHVYINDCWEDGGGETLL